MKLFIVVAVLAVAVAAYKVPAASDAPAAPANGNGKPAYGNGNGAAANGAAAAAAEPVAILNQFNELNEDGSFKYGFESADGIKVEASGTQKQVGEKPEDIGTVSKGSYSYTAPDGVVITVNWVADENGFQATGDHLPTPPPMPEHVVKMLEALKAKEEQPKNGNGNGNGKKSY